MAEAISKAVEGKYEMKVLCFSTYKKGARSFGKREEIIRCGTLFKLFSQPVSISIIREIKRLCVNYSPEYVIIHEPNPMLSYLITKYISYDSKLIVYWHSDIIKQKRAERLLRNLYYRELNRANVVIATSPNYVDGSKYLSRFKEKCRVIPNCIDEHDLLLDLECMKKAEEIRNRYDGKILCVSVGRMVPYKGFEYLARVSQIVDERFHFVVIGRRDASTNRIKKITSGRENFTIIENGSENDKKAYLKAADIFVFPSITKNEAFGIALAEGMYFGKPAVTYTIEGSGVNYVNVNGITGIEVQNKSISGYAQALTNLADNQKERLTMGKAAKKRIFEEFMFSSYITNLLKVLDDLD